MTGESATTRVERALAKAHASQETLNAFISFDDDIALERAAAIDVRLQRGEEVGPLAGVPIALKDLIDHEGRVTTSGSAFYSEVATSTAPCVRRLEDAGAVVIGRTNLHEWAFGFNSENEHWGPVRNPWNLETSPGGSSGGSGAAVAAGIVPIAIGSDTGGSVRVPAALCGTFGLKVTYGRIPIEGVFPLVPSVDTVGPLADSMDNIAFAYRAMSADETPEPGRRQLRIGVPEPWYERAPLADEIRASFESAVAAIRGLGLAVHPIHMPDTHPSSRINGALDEVAEVHREFRLRGERYGATVDVRIAAAEQLTPEEVAASREWQQMLRDRFADAFATVDFLITPACAARRKVIGEEMIGESDHRSVLSYFSAIVNHALRPALALPITGSGAPPASLQVIGNNGSEPALIGLGRWLEEAGIVGFAPAPANSPTSGDG